MGPKRLAAIDPPSLPPAKQPHQETTAPGSTPEASASSASTATPTSPASCSAPASSRFAGVLVTTFKTTSMSELKYTQARRMWSTLTARLWFPTLNPYVKPPLNEASYPSDGSALLVLPFGEPFVSGPFQKISAYVACTDVNDVRVGEVHLAYDPDTPPVYCHLVSDAGSSSIPLYLFGAKISGANSQYTPTVWINGTLTAAAVRPGQDIRSFPAHVRAFISATQQHAQQTAASETSSMLLAWEQREWPGSITTLPQDGAHARASLSPNPSVSCVVNDRKVLPLILTVNQRQYPVCTDSADVLRQLPGFDAFFTDLPYDDVELRSAFCASRPFSIVGTATTHTIGRTTFVTAFQQ
ncbi:hypothetical protein VOLCADRAFT_100611 [Volvox carteri f. nagariensis]|uniref:Uncharacterized protein n=1 Tax=Volvox carteri f. nagariensis TaxID=3068 RepID=D8UKM1_VOLCA|nr:uncharacterized protein VOLCADRAFT_100611 [Volvox carteri f. nagariensis]EFJ39725.1 hypothetical protein VOLCADRAFT_100611 [Volvox carteri f. nagariensis]|eukprot:XP_002959207.1 hypothetical protein VOLCADRAFT_100611 [Volvox carteri f. nagariensis]